MRGAAVLLAIAATVPTLLAREQNASLPVRERIITRNFPIYVPPHPCSVPSSIQFIAASVDAVSGTEYDGGAEHGPQPCKWQSAPPTQRDQIDLLGLTVEEALNTLVKLDPRYAWQESEGVIMLRPVAAWVDNKHFVHEPIGPIQFENKAMPAALDLLRPIIGRKSDGLGLPAGNTPHSWQEFSVHLAVMSGLEALNGVVRAHGNLHWELSYCQPERRREYATLFFWTSDRGGIGTASGGCAPKPKP
jgi:hypothetical protein